MVCFIKYWEKHPQSGPEVSTGHVVVCLGLDSDHAQLLLLDHVKHTSPWLLDVSTWKWMEIKKVSDSIVLKLCF